MGGGLAASRRSAIAYSFEHMCGCPPEDEWGGGADGGGVISLISRNRLGFDDVRV